MEHTIDISVSDAIATTNEFGEVEYELNLQASPDEAYIEINVYIDGEEGLLNYECQCYERWIDVDTTLNPAILRVLPNSEGVERTGLITFINNADETVNITLRITQSGDTRSITLSSSSIEFSELLSENSSTITVTVTGGRRRFYIKSINKYAPSGRSSYDDALIITTGKESEGVYSMTISVYGYIPTISGCYYEIVLSHMDDKTLNETIIVTFTDDEDIFDIPQIPTYSD